MQRKWEWGKLEYEYNYKNGELHGVGGTTITPMAKPPMPRVFQYWTTLFWGLLKASTLVVEVSREAIVVKQLWRIDNTWSERDIRDGYPDASPELLQERIGTPVFADGIQSKVTFTIRQTGKSSTIEMHQRGVSKFNRPIFAKHWMGLYLVPLKSGLEAGSER